MLSCQEEILRNIKPRPPSLTTKTPPLSLVTALTKRKQQLHGDSLFSVVHLLLKQDGIEAASVYVPLEALQHTEELSDVIIITNHFFSKTPRA